MIIMYTLKGIFPEPKKEQKKNFIRENMKQLKFIQEKAAKESKFPPNHPSSRLSNSKIPAGNSLSQVKSSPSNKDGKVSLSVAKTNSMNSRKNGPDIKIQKGDMAEFLRRKELRQLKINDDSNEEEAISTNSTGRLKDIGCQTIECNVYKDDNTKLTMLYPKKDDDDAKLKASGDSSLHRSLLSPKQTPRRAGDELQDYERPRSRLNAILERKDHKDPYLPTGYQKGVVPKYLRSRKQQEGGGVRQATGTGAWEDERGAGGAEGEHAECPLGHVTLPDNERKETLRMLRNSFAELVSELNKMPVKTDTLRMRNRKMELEKQLAKLEEGIKVFSRPKVFVKIGE